MTAPPVPCCPTCGEELTPISCDECGGTGQVSGIGCDDVVWLVDCQVCDGIGQMLLCFECEEEEA